MNPSESNANRLATSVTGRLSSIIRVLRTALPSLRTALIGSPLWCAAISLCAWFNIRLMSFSSEAQRIDVVAILATGAFLAFVPGVMISRLLAESKRQSQYMAAAILGLGAATIGITAIIYLFQFRSYYSIWHANVGARDWYWQQFYTSASAFYQFAVLGIRLYLPLGPFLLIGAAYALSTKRL